MTTYIINGEINIPGARQSVEAERYAEVGSYTVFFDNDDNQVLSIPTTNVMSIRREA
ncbi:hypothetical protein [Oerskovia paurometabola]|uniref:hypothetical protein n=1 Tax=Oerskovia paurometabola TaxID=162170 RepID=UPI00380F1CCD